MAQYAGSRGSSTISQPLKKCSYGTILQVKVQCLSRRLKIGDEESKGSNSQENNVNVDQYDPDPDRKSDRSYSSSRSPSEDTATTSHPMKSDSKESAQSVSGSVQSFNSVDGSPGSKNLLVKNVFKEYDSQTTQPGGSYENSPLRDDYSGGNDSPRKQPLVNSRPYSGEDFRNEAPVSRSSLTHISSSRSLLEVAEDTIEELRAEAKMWERNARKLMIDLDMSRKESSNLSKKQAELVMQLSAAYAEQDCLKQEVEKLKLELQILSTNQAVREEAFTQSQSSIRIQKELENEIKHQQELNDSLGQQLKQSQESNIALVSVLQELEETIEQQKIEMENLSSWKMDFADLESSMAKKSEEKQTSLLQLQKVQESEKKLQAHVQILGKSLRDKVDELDSNSLKAKLSGYVEGENNLKVLDENNVEFMREIDSLREKVQELERDCAELTDENLELLYKIKDLSKPDIRKCESFGSISSEHPNVSGSDGSEVSDPKYQSSHLEEELDNKPGFKNSEHLSEILKQMDMAFHHLRKPWHQVSCDESETSNNATATRMSSEYVLSSSQELNKLLGMRITESEEIVKNLELKLKEKNDIIADAEARKKDTELKIQEFEKLLARSEEDRANLMKELNQKRSEFDVIEANFGSKEQDIDFLLQQRRELEAEISEIQQKKSHLEQNMELVVGERNTLSERVENLQNDMAALCSTVNSHVSANSDLEKNIEELERKRHELENTLSVLEEENEKLQDSIVGLEDEKEICQQEANKFKSAAVSLHVEIKKLKAEMDTQILELKQMSEDMKEKWLGAQKECEYLQGENKTMQASVESSARDNVKLQNLNSDLKRENQELEGNCSALAAQLSELKKCLSDCTLKNESLEKHLTSVLDDFSLRENNLKSEIDALVKENSYLNEKLAQEGNLRQMFLEQSEEFESLQKEVEHLTRQVSDACHEKEQISFEASSEVSCLLADKAQLQASLQEVQFRAESAENKLNAALQESYLQCKDLTDQLTASQQSLEKQMVDNDRILKLLTNSKKSEEKLKSGMNDLELKLTISEYERQQLTKEMSTLKAQTQNISNLKDEVSKFRNELKECRLDKEKVELALKTVSREYEELKAEKISLSEKVAVLQEAMSEFEECNRNKLSLEEKLKQMEKELKAKDILCIQNDDLKTEITEMKRANMQFRQKMYRLEEKRDVYLKQVQILQEERTNIYKEGNFHDGSSHAMSGNHMTERQLLENESLEEPDENNRSRVQHDSDHENYAAAPKKSTVSGEMGPRERYDRTKSSLQAELRELRERYLEMSLKYAEVEAQREDLVMKLKATRPGRKWFA